MGAVTVLTTIVVEPDRSLRLPSRAEWRKMVTEPGEYAVVPFHEVRDRKAMEPHKRVFHLGDLKLTEGETESLTRCGMALSTQVRAAGVPMLRRWLGDELTQKLVVAFERLGIPIPDRDGDQTEVLRLGICEAAEVLIQQIREGYTAHATVWRIREEMAALVRENGSSSFIQHAAGFDIVCGVCGAQHLAVPEKVAVAMVCTHCGNDVGLDFRVELEEHRLVVRRKIEKAG